MEHYPMREVASGLGFIEGPMALPDGRILFTDVGGGWLMTVDPVSGEVAKFAETKGGPNAAAIGPDGFYYVCNNGGLGMSKSPQGYTLPIAGSHGDQPIAAGIQRVSPDGKVVTTLYSECNGVPLVAPNDLVFDSSGGFYFTDTGHPHGRDADLGGLYYAKADGSSIVELIHEAAPHAPLTQPNGCGLSPDGSRVYVAETGSGRLWYWNIESPGKLAATPEAFSANGAVFLYGMDGYNFFDSLAVDSAGNVCVATIMKGGISVVTPEGQLKDFIPLPVYDPFPTNICFAGEGLSKAYVTAAGTGRIYEIEWPRAGLALNYG